MHRCDVLIVGGGFGGALGARRLERLLRKTTKRIVLIAPTNFMLFSPLLPEAASGTIEPRHTVIPLREMLDTTVVQIGTVTGLDIAARTASITDLDGEHHQIGFESALLAPGSVPATYPIRGLIEEAVGFKTLADAIWLRNRVLFQLDAAAAASNPERRSSLLTFTFVGGGYAGVEGVAELQSLARDALRRYPTLSEEDFRWVLVEAEDSLLPGLDPGLARYTLSILRERGVEVHLGTRLVDCVDRVVRLDPAVVAPFRSETIVWAAGQRPAPLAAAWGLPTDDRGFVPVDDRMQVAGLDGIYAVGDFAAVPDPSGSGTAPNTAQHALRQATVAAANIAARHGVGGGKRYDYRTRGLAVTLGKWKGAAQVGGIAFRGAPAWWMGRSYHLLMMPGFGRKSRVVADWTLGLLFPRDVSQLGSLGSPTPLGEPAAPLLQGK
jgi:NADH dehydrogenase